MSRTIDTGAQFAVRSRGVCFAAVVGALLLPARSAWAQVSSFTETDLGIGADYSTALGINNNGQIVGLSRDAAFVQTAFVWDNGTVTFLQNPQTGAPLRIIPIAINDAGQVLGRTGSVRNGHAVLWTAAAGLVDLPLHRASDINNLGQVVGSTQENVVCNGVTVGPVDRAALWNAGTVVPIGPPGSVALGINDSGVVVGQLDSSFTGCFPTDRGFLWDASSGATLIPFAPGYEQALMLPGGGISDQGLVVSGDWLYDSVSGNWFQWRNVALTDFRGGPPHSINHSGWVVEVPVREDLPIFSDGSAFSPLYLSDLFPNFTIDSLTINDVGEIAGADKFLIGSAFHTHAVLLRPVLSANRPLIIGLDPSSAGPNGPALTLSVTGTGFSNASNVLWNGTPLSTTFVDPSTLTASVTASDRASSADLTVVAVTVVDGGSTNPPTSNTMPFTLKTAKVAADASKVTGENGSATVFLPPGAPDQAGISAELVHGSPGSAILTGATYLQNPTPAKLFDTGGGYVDLRVNNALSSDFVNATFYYPSTLTGAAESAAQLLYYDAAAAAWAPVLDSGGLVPVKDTTDNIGGTTSGGAFYVTFDNTSTPLVTNLTGTPFAMVMSDAPPVANPSGPYVCAPNTTISLDGSGSSDPDPGDAITYAWDLVNSGRFETAGVRPSFTCGAIAGSVSSVCLRVTDNAGLRDTKCTTVMIVSPPDCQTGTAALMACNGGSVSFQVDGSASSDPGGKPLKFTWTAGSCDAGAVTFSNAYAAKTEASFNTGLMSSCFDSCKVTLTCINEFSQSTSSVTLMVGDTASPVFTAPPHDTTVECDGGGNQAALNAFLSTVGASDACLQPGLTNVSNDFHGLTQACGATGSASVTWTATNGCGPAATTSASFRIVDYSTPTIQCPAPIVAECTGNRSAAVDAGKANGSDVCSAVSVSGPPPGFALGKTTTTFTATDQCGNTSTCDSSVTVLDTTPPSITCPSPTTAECTGNASAPVTPAAATASDICTSVVSIQGPPAGSYPLGSTTVSYVATDESSNSGSCASTINVVDTIPPVFDASSLAARTVMGSCAASPVAFVLPSASDSCTSAKVTCDPLPGNNFGANTVACKAMDQSGNVSTTTLTVYVQQPLHVVFLRPLLDDNVADDVDTDADVNNLFQPGWIIPHSVHLLDCAEKDVTSTAPVTVKLSVSRGANGEGGTFVNDIDDIPGIGDEGGVMVLLFGAYRYALLTNPVDFPRGGHVFRSLVTASYTGTPDLIVGAEDARLVSK
ncbi:MAG: HYR domain-containing protein [Deltaproteobacteria bacterium]|nr:MAG: HYR domain-containing protein [Deltaproteobacteria bacterium]